MERTVEALCVEVSARPMPIQLWGLTPDANHVVVNESLSGWERRYAIAHELGHVMCLRGLLPLIAAEELICDWVAYEFLVPLADVESFDWEAGELAEAYGVGTFTASAQLISAGRLPPLVRTVDGVVICARCGHRAHLPGCECRRYRYDTLLPLPVV